MINKIKTGTFSKVSIDNLDKFKESTNKKYCRNCVRLYITGADQCEVPACGLCKGDQTLKEKENESTTGPLLILLKKEHNPYSDQHTRSKPNKDGARYILQHADYIHLNDSGKKLYVHPSSFNKFGECPFYKTLPSVLRCRIILQIARMFIN